MDWLKKAAGWLGNVAYQGAKFIPGVGNSIRAYEDLSRRTNQARQQLQQRQPQRKLPPAPAPRLDYKAAMQALNALKQVPNVTKPALGVTLGDIGRQVPNATKQVVQGGKDVAKGFVANPVRLGKMIAYPIIESDMRKKLNRGEINYDTYNRLATQAANDAGIGVGDSSFTTARKVGGTVGGTALDILTAGTMSPKLAVGLQTGRLGKAARYTAPLANRIAAGAATGGLLGGANLLQRDKITKQQAAADIGGGVAIGAAFPAALAGAGRIVGGLKGKPVPRPINNNAPKSALAGLSDASLNERNYISNLQFAQGEGASLPKDLPAGKKAQLLADFQAAQQRAGAVQTVNGKKVFAPDYQPTQGTGKLGKFSENFNPREKGTQRFTANAANPQARALQLQLLDHADNLSKGIQDLPANNPKRVAAEKAIAVARTEAQRLETALPVTQNGRTVFKNEFTGDLKQDPLEALKAEARKYKSADEFVKAQGEPMYHGSPNAKSIERNGFKAGKNEGELGKGIYLTSDKTSANLFGNVEENNLVQAHLLGVKPYEISDFNSSEANKIASKIIKNNNLPPTLKGISKKDLADRIAETWNNPGSQRLWLEKAGYGGITDKNSQIAGQVVVFNPENIKTKSQLTDLYNQATKPKRYNELVPKDYLNPKDEKIGKALGMSDAQMLETQGITKAGVTAKEMAQVRKLGYTPEDITYLSASQLKQAVKNKIPVSQGLNQLNASENFANPVVPGLKKRGFVSTLQDDFGVPSDLTDVLPAGYRPVGNAATFARAKTVVDSDPKILSKLMSKPKETITATDQAQLQILLRRAVENDDLKTAQRVATKLDVNAREAGRTVQIMAAWKKTTPEGALSQAYKVVEEAQKKFPGKNIELTPEKAATIRQLANEIQKYGVGTRERDVASAMLEKEIAGIVPATVGRKLSTVQTMAQLLNPKTAIRNLGGNSVFGGLENISTTLGAGVDKTIGKVTKQRSLTVPSYMTQIKGFIKGGKYGLEDTKLGIKTSGASGQYDIRPDVFKNGILKKLEHAVGYELSVPDKAFYQAAFDDSLRNQMKAMGKTKPDVALVDTANREALYRTFQNNSTIAETLSKIKGGMNKIGISNGDFGLGDFILKYPKTPGNILASGLDYAGGGIIKGGKALYQGARQGGLTQQAQREASMNIGRGLTGLGLVGGGYGLARAGAVTADPDKDKDVANLEKGAGQGPFNINLSGLGRLVNGGDAGVKQGDLNANYDWLQPASLPFTIGANVGTKQSAKDQGANLIDALNAGINTVTDQPVLQGLGKLFSSLVGQRPNPTQGIQNAVQGAPGSFVPSLLNQIGQLTDKSARNTYSPNYWEGMLNQAKTRVPGLRTSLQPRVDTFGNTQKTYEDNNVFNVFLNPAFVKHYNLTPEAKMVLDVNSNTGETTQFPRVAPYNTQVNGQKHELTSEELRKFQEFTGTKTQDAYARMVNDPAFQKLSDTDKAKRMSDVLTDVAAAAKIAVLGDIPKDRPSKGVQQLIQGGEARYSAKTVQSGGSTTASNPQERYQNAVEKYNQDKADGSISDIKDISAQQTLNRLKVQSTYSQDIVDLYGLSKSKIDTYLKQSPRGGELFNQLIQMDDAIVQAGGNSKFRDSKGVVRITPRPKKGKKGRKVKIARAKLPARSGTGRKIARVSAGRAPKIKFASAPRSSKTAKIKVG